MSGGVELRKLTPTPSPEANRKEQVSNKTKYFRLRLVWLRADRERETLVGVVLREHLINWSSEFLQVLCTVHPVKTNKNGEGSDF